MALVHFEGDAEWLKVAIAGHAASFRVESGAWKDVSCGGNDRLQGRGAAPYNVVVGARFVVDSAARDVVPPCVVSTATPTGR